MASGAAGGHRERPPRGRRAAQSGSCSPRCRCERSWRRLRPRRPRLDEVRLDTSSFIVTAAITLACALICTVVPAWRAARVDPGDTLKASALSTTPGHRWIAIRAWLVGGEVALTAMLLVVGGLLVASFVNVLRVDRGFTTTSVVAADIELPAARYPDGPSRARFFDALLEALGREPGVGVAGLSRALPLEGLATVDGFVPCGRRERSRVTGGRQSRSGERRIFRRDRFAPASWTPVDAGRSRASGRRHQRPHRQDVMARTGRARPELQARSRRPFRGHRRCRRREDPGLRAGTWPGRLHPLRVSIRETDSRW